MYFSWRKNDDKHINTDDIFANYIGVIFQKLLEIYKNIYTSSSYLSTHCCKYTPVFSPVCFVYRNKHAFNQRELGGGVSLKEKWS